ncbi:MAG: DUF3644 domain-containing protein [Nitrospiraceae bacterium]|nr:MAG: DUF3644 domain-containing protein [Nitrospiraceae bacterium]
MRGLPRQAKSALEKARDSGLLAVEVYNKPAVKFKSGCYISLMVIAWTSLLHAVFFKRKFKPFYKKENGRYMTVDGDFKYWELDECLRQYFKADTGNPVRKNLEFFIPLRNKIEHRSMPEIDASIFGECQAMLLNFDEILEKEFGTKYCLRECLSFSLQMFPSAESLVTAVMHHPDTKPVVEFIQQYRSTISQDITASGKYSFKAFLIQVANHKSENALPIQFIHYDKLSEEQRKQVSQFGAMVKFKEVPVANLNIMKAGEVVKKVQGALGNPKIQRGNRQVDRFNLTVHAVCWKKYKARPSGGSSNPEQTDYRYCIYDKMHNDYGFTQAWVDFIVEKLRDPKEFDSLYKIVPPAAGTSIA